MYFWPVKIGQITFTRFVAAMAIVISHFNKDLFLYKIKFISDIFLRANVGVSYFFILSGFIMIVAYHKKEKIGYLDFYRNRVARIYPLYIVGLLLYFLTRYSDFSLYKTLLYLSGIQSWIPGKALIANFPGWSISVEFLFYLIFPWLYNYLYSKGNKSIWIIALLIWIGTQVFSNLYINSRSYKGPHTDSHEFIHYFPLWHINEFLIGNLAGLFFVKNHEKKNYDLAIVLLFTGIMLSLIFIPLNFHNGLMAVLFVPAIYMISCNNGLITRFFSMKPLEFLGEISYAMYIIHIPLLYILRSVLWNYFQVSQSNTVFWIYILILMAVSAIFYEFIEKPMRDYLRKIRF
ncbi:acyltransferase family protein [Chryseobacterium profundimaris]|uniref:Peptidoglycan/LPS O-acetylase OafA/YrhL, contains acyltransferase and SGNH-hydrolase domains n=1 Tax=Chryseobacterium profundimaris TaxID=1387275 RepID=A0ABY1NDW3_9FLAO|nr:acyltransferase [Chryseobacterium profundimaris]SMP07312.1 Peptidoglycan/LPS O-acetylase OafA/YrhL, contains acyltransferase and SGNH-hydrolase domains [Chryseobacterium profundimaris]